MVGEGGSNQRECGVTSLKPTASALHLNVCISLVKVTNGSVNELHSFFEVKIPLQAALGGERWGVGT